MVGKAGTAALYGIIDILADGKVEAKEFRDIMRSVIGMIGQHLLGQGAGLLGGLFNFGNPAPLKLGFQIPGYATGTDDQPGGLARIFERGGEIVDLPKHIRVIPHDISMAPAKSAGRQDAQETVVLNYSPMMDLRGADPSVLARIEQRSKSKLPGSSGRLRRWLGICGNHAALQSRSP